jgi:[glutamine synthetase] adenylyltransferase / [glutamine synthetase]-adenylyl-L-tyrosine phosphorylase
MSTLNVKDLLLAPQLDSATVAQLLRPYGLKDPVRADANLQTVATEPSERQLLATILEQLLVSIAHSANPDQALTYFERFARSGLNKPQLLSYLAGSPQALETLIKSLGGSSYMAEILIRDPQLFYWVTDPQILERPRRKREIQRDILSTAKALSAESQRLDYLRFLKRREMLHIGVRDLLRISSVEGTWTSLSILAEALISGAYAISAAALREEFGITGPMPTRFTVLAMGKLGGGELNFSSDVDLMYLYEASTDEAHGLSATEYARRLSQKITQGLNSFTGEGYVYRVDLRLRPEGKAGNIADSLEGYRRYYQRRLAAWERLALLKAWPVAGSRQLGAAFLKTAEEFIYSGSFDREALQNILHMKRKIDEKAANQRRGARNVKLGPGGIREIELVAQSLQACYGKRMPQLRKRNTVSALQALCSERLLSEEEYDSLSRAYVFLRDVENKLQMVQDAQTHWLPIADDELAACVRLLGYGKDQNPEEALEAFERDYRLHTNRVNRIFEDLLGTSDPARFSR